jgi:hypothetical protein
VQPSTEKEEEEIDVGAQNKLEEERRVAYVLFSRAKEMLHLSAPKLPFHSIGPACKPSIFIKEILDKYARAVLPDVYSLLCKVWRSGHLSRVGERTNQSARG